MSFYNKFIKPNRMGFTLRGGPFSKWRLPLASVLYRKRIEVGPEPQRPRSVWSNWFVSLKILNNQSYNC